jgi:hypothetical protein
VNRVLAVVLLAGLAGGCGATSKVARTAAPTTLAGTFRPHLAGTPAPGGGPLILQDDLAPRPEPAAMPAPKVLCDAPSLTYLIGHSRKDIPVPADLSHRRVMCTTCPANDGYQPTRTNILFNTNTGIIAAVKCG